MRSASTASRSRLLLTADPVISEFMASNNQALASKATLPIPVAFPDWIEIHNVDPANTLDLTGWYLSNSNSADREQAGRQQVPDPEAGRRDTTIPPNGYLVVFASNQATGGYFPIPAAAAAVSELHANFNLGASGDSVVFAKADGPNPWHEPAGHRVAVHLEHARSVRAASGRS